MYSIDIAPSALRELKMVPVFYRRLIANAVERQLAHEPSKATKNRKCLMGLVTGFEHEPPIWELRVQMWRVFYDIDEEEKTVVIRAVRLKPAGRATGEIV